MSAGVQTDQPAEPLSPGLYIVATPIGNLGDITLRAIETLSRCGAVACEDTRVTGKLMKHLGISKPLRRYDDHADENARERILATLADQAVVLVSDAGTPLISDPGYRLVREAKDLGYPVTALPGPCAAIAGLAMSGLPSDKFLFAGFLPVKDKARRDMLAEVANTNACLVFYETGPRLTKSLAVLLDMMPDREVAVAREITKLHEECRRGLPAGLLAYYEAHPPKGEIVLMIGPPDGEALSTEDPDTLLREALLTMKTSQAAAQVAKATGLDRKALYARAMELKE
ncbi:16S rRNA (cytidine(1402)-2'-O)-methyltransferase [Parerythrobacter jejuensis]|uniref:Ribosomal RNA small subunit methyltransferase I n=1 Tax=Parerythrobacter jejuensis TaxID=795812 RepID=A0A845AU44_9SPHN|nr:16S rRNA (cytidine(1402)-2'-O)-methyltransferase [Parerythrobacter jejuensis]MXP32341.1 16S rRNA (cytidine(1402)-2'-O)-methyltransferase [Parerythrobacter jejuensis]